MPLVKITGQVQYINPVATSGNGQYQSRSLIILENPGQYQSYMELTFGSNNMSMIDQLQNGQTYEFEVSWSGSKQILASSKHQGHATAFSNTYVRSITGLQQAAAPAPQFQQQAQPTQQFGQGASFPSQQIQQQPAQPQQGFGNPAPVQQGFQQQQQPAPGFQAPAQGGGFAAPQQQGFEQPQTNTAPAQPAFGFNPNPQ